MITENIAASWMDEPTATPVLVVTDRAVSPSTAQPPVNNGAGNPKAATLQPIKKHTPLLPVVVVVAIAAAAIWASSEL